MTGTDDRLDEIEQRARLCGLMSSGSPGGVALMDVAWVISELRDARAENERLERTVWDDARKVGQRIAGIEAELAAERAKVERVEHLCTARETFARKVVPTFAIRRALTGEADHV